ncbi:MAG: hypothetical protein GXP43_00115, partial [bacterium]|nr:hypothetical protein [bacterium]
PYQSELADVSPPDFPFVPKPDCLLTGDRLTQKIQEAIADRGVGTAKETRIAAAILARLNQTGIAQADRLLKLRPRKILSSGRLFLMRSSDILNQVALGLISAGIVPADKILEAQLNGLPIKPLGYLGPVGQCWFKLGFPFISTPIKDMAAIKDCLSSIKIATPYPKTLTYLLRQQAIFLSDDQVVSIQGSVEIMPWVSSEIKAVADIVDTGETSFANGILMALNLIKFPGVYLIGRRSQLKT